MPHPLRIAPLPAADREPRVAELLDGLRFDTSRPELNIFATLARHPKLLRKMADFGGQLLYGGALPARDRELLILRTAFNCGSDYEWGQHVIIAEQAGLGRDEIDRVASALDAGGWNERDACLLGAADELHASSTLSDATWANLATHYDQAQLIEFCMLIGNYHMIAFTLNALGVQREPGVGGFPT